MKVGEFLVEERLGEEESLVISREYLRVDGLFEERLGEVLRVDGVGERVGGVFEERPGEEEGSSEKDDLRVGGVFEERPGEEEEGLEISREVLRVEEEEGSREKEDLRVGGVFDERPGEEEEEDFPLLDK